MQFLYQLVDSTCKSKDKRIIIRYSAESVPRNRLPNASRMTLIIVTFVSKIIDHKGHTKLTMKVQFYNVVWDIEAGQFAVASRTASPLLLSPIPDCDKIVFVPINILFFRKISHEKIDFHLCLCYVIVHPRLHTGV